ncbi:MAG TPA: glycosyltransferase family 1 protein [Thermoanaerobaculia bacterium]|nr:glycosyltransferase family 1 protein [Thermoanaerobaculia bacterium]
MRAIVTGMIATYPVGGVVWDYGQYALGLESLGWEVYYLEDTGTETYDPRRGEYGADCSHAVAFLDESLRALSPTLGERWHFRSMNGETYGVPRSRFQEIVGGADLFLNVSGGTLLREEYAASPRKVLLDSDPGWNHFVNYPKWDAKPGWQGTLGYRAHDVFLTYAENLGQPDCLLPDLGLRWHPTRPPVLLDHWSASPPGDTWTTVMTWNNFRRPVEYQGRAYGTKEMEFPEIEDLPAAVPRLALEVATGGSSPPVERWRELGWRVIDSHTVSASAEDYRRYVQSSRGELSVAKNLYVATRSGWFSCRSVCYLASGRPVILQDTAFSRWVPTGLGVLPFSSRSEAVDALEAVEADYDRHCRAAREIAAEEFGAERVLRRLLAQVGLG